MKSAVVDARPSFQREVELVKRVLERLEGALKLRGCYFEIYLTGKTKSVLAYPPPKNFPRPDIKRYKNLGEIYLNPDPDTLTPNLIHGLLHLLGYDHKKKSDRIKMNQKEKQLCQVIKSSL